MTLDRRRVIVDPRAEAELSDAVQWYERHRTGLGHEFLIEFSVARERIAENPDAWPQISRRIRKYRLKRFPYDVIYQLLPAEIRIIAVPHQHRRPGYWKNRMQ